jgi:hypothetical protein
VKRGLTSLEEVEAVTNCREMRYGSSRQEGRQGAAKLINFAWTGKDKAGKVVKGELRAPGEAAVTTTLRRQGIQVTQRQEGFRAAERRSPTRTSRSSRASSR